MARFGFFSDLRGQTFAEGQGKWIQAMRVGEYQHAAYGKINFTADRLKRFADSVKNKVRGIDLDIDYDHKTDPARGNEAAGWVKDAEVRDNALWLFVEWTKTAAEKIQEGAYRYFSPEFKDEWTDAQGRTFQDVLFGGGITNRPFLKDLLPVNLSELSFAEPKEGTGMKIEELRKLYGLPDDGSQDDQILDRAKADREAATSKSGTTPDHTATTHAPNNPAGNVPQLDGKPFDATTAGQALDKDGNQRTPEEFELSELAKTNPAIAILLSEREDSRRRLAELELDNKRNGIRVKLNETYGSGDKILTPAARAEAEALLVALPTQLHERVYNLLDQVKGGTATVQLGERGHSGDPTGRGNDTSAIDKVEAEVKKLTEGGKMSVADAYEEVFRQDRQLFSEYQSAAYAFKTA